MIAFAMVAAWIAYAVGMYGYILVRGYDLTVWQVVSPNKYYTGKWPPPMAPNNVIFPGGSSAGGAPSSNQSAGSKVANAAATGAKTAVETQGQTAPQNAGQIASTAAKNSVVSVLNGIIPGLGDIVGKVLP